ncbi:MAG: hypothetical protein IKF44_00520 [Mycoplasmataceae bacterium]|nr:hypothetical protein [Mycoplasmataceae bacterium]
MYNKKTQLEAINLAVKSFARNKIFNLFDVNFELRRNETLGIFFEEKDSKESFLSIFQNINFKYMGLLFLDSNLARLEKNPHSFSKVHFDNIFDNVNPNKRIFEILEKKVLDSQFNSILEVIKRNNKLEKQLKILKFYKYKKLEYSYTKSVNILTTNAIKFLVQHMEKFKKAIANKEPIDKLYEIFIHSRIKYLKGRINLIVDRNILFMNLYFKELKRKILDDKYFYEKSKKKIVSKIKEVDLYDKKLLKFKKDFLYSFNENNDVFFDTKFQKYVFSLLIKEIRIKSHLYNKKMKDEKKHNKNYWLYYKHKLTSTEFIKVLKKESPNLVYLTKEESIEFYKELKKCYIKLLINQENSSILKTKSFIKKSLSYYIDNELFLIIEKYKEISENKKELFRKQILKNKLDKKIKGSKNNDLISNVWNLKNEIQDLNDDIEWRKKTFFYNLSENLAQIISLINEELNEYKKNKGIYNDLIVEFLNLKNKYINENEITLTEKLSNEFFEEETSKFENIYRFIRSDSYLLEKIFTKFSLKNKNNNLNEVSTISKYLILKNSKKFDLTIFDLLKKIGKSSLFLKKNVMLLMAYLDGKEISILNGMFSKLEKEEKDKLISIYKKVSSSSNKSWILIEDNLEQIKNALDNVVIISNSRQIESGSAFEISTNPLYNATRKAFGLKPINGRETPKKFYNIINYSYDYDSYKVGKNHLIYGDLEEIYNWSQSMPEETFWTNFPEKFDHVQNKIVFKNINKKNKTNIFMNDHNNFDDSISKEYLIVDV